MKENKIIRLVALLACFGLIITAGGCFGKNKENEQHVESESEIDAFAQSIDGIKSAYEKNEMSKSTLDDAVTQAKVLQSFFAETPELYEDEEYKAKISAVYQTINSIDLSKEGLNIEEGADASFNSLKQIINVINGSF